MKKIKMSVAALLIAGMSYGQTDTSGIELDYNGVTLQTDLVYEMLGTLGDILEWQQYDIEEAKENGEDCSCGSYEEKWGSNYWLTLMRDDLWQALDSARLR
tara:strand:- start:1284 stop:1586 length:303 start_codon:yes stop_codon:yes gene_type:complete